MRATLAFLTALLLLGATACGGGSGTDGTIGGGGGGSNNLAANFTPDQPAPVANSVALKKGGASGNLVTLEVTITDVADVFGVDFDLTFDANRAQYVNWRPGSALESGGESVSYLVEAPQPGRLVVGASPEHLVLTRDGTTLYVNNVGDGTVSVLDLPSGTVSGTFAVGDTPHGLDLSDDGRTLFVSALGDDKLTVIDLTTGAGKSVALGPAPYHLSVLRDTGKLYVSSAEEPETLYAGFQLATLFERTASRLAEMRTRKYLRLPHRCGP